MYKKNILLLSLFIYVTSSCGGGGGGSSVSDQQSNSITPAPTPIPAPSPAPAPTPSIISITSNLIAQAKGTIDGEISYAEIDREFVLYVPSTYDSSAKQPLVFNFHGYGSNAYEQMNYGDLRSQADTNGFILVHPEGLDDISGRSYWNMGGWSTSIHDDVKFTENLINLLMDKYSINAERIYSTGMSNGGFFSFHLACNLNASFAAIASVTGSMSFDTFNDCNPRKPTPILQIHGSIDTVVPYNGIISIMKPVMDVMDYWKATNGCNDYSLNTDDRIYEDTFYTDIYTYDGCLNGTQNIHLLINEAGHIWPGSIYESLSDPVASQRIWDFFSNYDINGLMEDSLLPLLNDSQSQVSPADSQPDSSEATSQTPSSETSQNNDATSAEGVSLESLPSNITTNLELQIKGTINGKISYEGIDREFILYVPETYDLNQRQPLVLNFHGYTSSANEHLNYGDLRVQADAEGFILVYPDALNDVKGKSYWNMGGWSESDHDDLEFIKNLIKLLKNKYSINPDRIYTTGHSNGGFFSFHLACNLNSLIAAVASITGSMSLETFNECNPKKPLPILQIHGSEDTVVPYSGNTVLGVENAMKPIMDVMQYWRIHNQCDEYVLSGEIYEGSAITTDTYTYQNCLNNIENVHILVNGAGHEWPGAESAETKEPKANIKIWEFFSKYDINGVIQ